MAASEGPAPPRRPSTPVSSIRTPALCSSVSSGPSSARTAHCCASAAAIKLLEVAVEDSVLELVADTSPIYLPVLTVEIAPGFVSREKHPIAADPPALDLGQHQARSEADGPRSVGVQLVALL